uniref:Uncharacterized protein n=1 Tax=Mesembryanthemum crystallinum TaxID=3544 RepID=A0A0Y0SUW7_MESCR|nr:hypothetical protein [Mesembryanthemum crystallinum]
MASTQQVHHQTILNEVMKELDSHVSKQNVKVNQEQALTNGAIGNHAKCNLELKSINEYSGHFSTPGPAQILEDGNITKFEHEGTPPQGSKVGVAYHAKGHQWVMAWMVPLQNPATKPALNKVYIEDGPDAEIDWKDIEMKLESSREYSFCPGGLASITQGSVAKLAAAFIDPENPPNN